MNTEKRPVSRLLLVAGGFAASLVSIAIILLAVFCWAVSTGRIADTKVTAGHKLLPRVARAVSASAELRPGEQVLFFYSAAITPEGDGNLLTDQRVISYVDDGTDAWCASIEIDDIVDVQFIKSESWIDDSTIIVTSSDGTELTLYASIESGGDERFVDSIRSAVDLESE